jgi:hypothetical protein
LATVYGGAGIDIVTGKSDMEANLDGTLTGLPPGGGEVALGTATITATESDGPSTGRMRFLAGLQFNILVARIFAQGNFAPDGAAGLSLGARVAW